MGAWERQPGGVYPSWMSDPVKLAKRRVTELWVGQTVRITIAGSDYIVERVPSRYGVSGRIVVRQGGHVVLEASNIHEIIDWISGGNMATRISDKAIELLRELAAAGKVGIARKRLGYAANLVASLERKQPPMIINVSGLITLTIAGAEYLRGLPEFDTPVPDMGMGDAPQVQETPFPRISGGNMATGSLGKAIELLRELAAAEGGVTRSTLNYPRSLVKWLEDYGLLVEEDGKLCITPIGGAYLRRPEFDTPINTPHPQPLSQPQERGEEPGALVRVVLADGFELAEVVRHSYSEMVSGQIVIYLTVTEALALALYPQLNYVRAALGMAGVETTVSADLTIRLVQEQDDYSPF